MHLRLLMAWTLVGLASGCPSEPVADDDTSEADDAECTREEMLGSFGVETNHNGGSFWGVYYDNPDPRMLAAVAEDGDCVFHRYQAVECDPPCDSPLTCAYDGECRPEPERLDAGTVTVLGTDPPLVVLPTDTNIYYTTELYPGLTEAGSTITLEVRGSDDVASFATSVHATAWINPYEQTVTLIEGQPLTITWDGAGEPEDGRVRVQLDNDHHGISAYAVCDAEASLGELTVPVSIVELMIEAGSSGIGTYVENATIIRYSESVVRNDPGCVSFMTLSSGQLYVETVLQ